MKWVIYFPDLTFKNKTTKRDGVANPVPLACIVYNWKTQHIIFPLSFHLLPLPFHLLPFNFIYSTYPLASY